MEDQHSLLGNLTISMAMFDSYVKLTDGTSQCDVNNDRVLVTVQLDAEGRVMFDQYLGPPNVGCVHHLLLPIINMIYTYVHILYHDQTPPKKSQCSMGRSSINSNFQEL